MIKKKTFAFKKVNGSRDSQCSENWSANFEIFNDIWQMCAWGVQSCNTFEFSLILGQNLAFVELLEKETCEMSSYEMRSYGKVFIEGLEWMAPLVGM